MEILNLEVSVIKVKLKMESKKCIECERELSLSLFWYKKNKKIYPICKECCNKMYTIIAFCNEFDIPYIEKEWNRIQHFGKYLATMKLPAYYPFNYKDSNFFAQETNNV